MYVNIQVTVLALEVVNHMTNHAIKQPPSLSNTLQQKSMVLH